MAVINCPSCNKKISDKAKSCSHCDINLETLDAEKLASLKKTEKINKSQSLMNQSFVAMLLFCGGFLFFYWQNVQPATWQYFTCIASTLVGFFWYIVIRVQLLLLKRK